MLPERVTEDPPPDLEDALTVGPHGPGPADIRERVLVSPTPCCVDRR